MSAAETAENCASIDPKILFATFAHSYYLQGNGESNLVPRLR